MSPAERPTVLLVFGVGACVARGTYLVRTDWGDQ